MVSDQNLVHLEAQATRDVQELQCQAVDRGAQAKANGMPPVSPVCASNHTRLSRDHSRTFTTRFGEITIRRTRGYCKRCRN